MAETITATGLLRRHKNVCGEIEEFLEWCTVMPLSADQLRAQIAEIRGLVLSLELPRGIRPYARAVATARVRAIVTRCDEALATLEAVH